MCDWSGTRTSSPGTGQRAQRDLVRHRPRSAGRGPPRSRAVPATSVLEPVDRGILAVLVVADLRLGHGAAHRRARQGHRVRAQVDPVDHGPMIGEATQPAGRRRVETGRRWTGPRRRPVRRSGGAGSAREATPPPPRDPRRRTAWRGRRPRAGRRGGGIEARSMPGADQHAGQREEVSRLMLRASSSSWVPSMTRRRVAGRGQASVELVRREHLGLGQELGEQAPNPRLAIRDPQHPGHRRSA
jgi:hypothetical protein